MNNKIKDIAAKFLSEEKIPVKEALMLASLGLSKNVGDIADLAYGVNYSQHPYNEERQNELAEYLGYVMLNWQILALASGFNGDEIINRFIAEWQSKHNNKASIKDLLKHLKSNVKAEQNTQQQQVSREPAQIDPTQQI